MNRIYIVLFDTEHANEGTIKHYVYHCFAENAKEACRMAREQWPIALRFMEKFPCPVRMHAVRSRFSRPDFCRVISWRDDVFNGKACFDFICTGLSPLARKGGAAR